MRRVSVAGLMGSVLVCAVAMAALRNANELWAGVLLLLATALLGVAVLGLIQQRGSARAWWLGYAVFSGGYLALAFGPGFSESVAPKLGTAQALAYVHSLASSPDPFSPSLQNLYTRRAALISRIDKIRRVTRSQRDPATVAAQSQLATVEGQIGTATGIVFTGAPSGPKNRWRTLIPGAANYEPFLRVGHALFALAAGWLGATVSCRFHSRHNDRPADEPLTPA